LSAIRDQIGNDQGGREKDQAEDEVPEKAMPFASSKAGWPKGDHHPDREKTRSNQATSQVKQRAFEPPSVRDRSSPG
jgi:hypothetical protein